MDKNPSTQPAKVSSAIAKAKQQYDLFTTFFGDARNLSNTIELWDAIPKYAVSARAQKQMRDASGNLPVYEQEFVYRPTIDGMPKEIQCKLTIQPTHIKNGDGAYQQVYPSTDEELVEEVLKKLFTDQTYGHYSPGTNESRVKFSLNMIQNELKARGKTRSLLEIKRSLEILSRAVLTVQFIGSSGKMIYTNPILTDLIGVTRSDFITDPKAMWCAQLPALISKSVSELSYRQFNYGKLMSLSSQLSRWFHKRLSHQYTQASLVDSYHIMYSAICRDSGLLHQKRTSANIKTIDAALEELKEQKVIMHYTKEDRRQGGKIIDVKYTMLATATFRDEIKTANARQGKARVELGLDPDLSRIPRSAGRGVGV